MASRGKNKNGASKSSSSADLPVKDKPRSKKKSEGPNIAIVGAIAMGVVAMALVAFSALTGRMSGHSQTTVTPTGDYPRTLSSGVTVTGAVPRTRMTPDQTFPGLLFFAFLRGLISFFAQRRKSRSLTHRTCSRTHLCKNGLRSNAVST